MDVRGNGRLVKNTRSRRDHPETRGSHGYSCIFTGSLCFTSQLCIVLHCWSFMYRVLGSLEWFGLTSRAVCSQVPRASFPVYTVRLILPLVGLAFRDYKDFFIFLSCLCLLFFFFFFFILFPAWSTYVRSVPVSAIPIAAVHNVHAITRFFTPVRGFHLCFDDSLNTEGYGHFWKKVARPRWNGRFVNDLLIKPAAVFKFRFSLLLPLSLLRFLLFFSVFATTQARLARPMILNRSLWSTSIALPFI